MLITRISKLTGVTHTLDIPVTENQLDAWKEGGLIQDIMPHLTPNQREFIMTGITPEEWDAMIEVLSDDDDEDEADS